MTTMRTFALHQCGMKLLHGSLCEADQANFLGLRVYFSRLLLLNGPVPVMQTRALTTIAVLLSLALTLSPTRGETQTKLPVVVEPNISDIESTDRAIFSPDGQLVATLDGFVARSVKLWDVASGRPLRTLEYETYFGAVAFSPDGKWMASAHKDRKIKLWDVTTGATTATLQVKSQAGRVDDEDAVWSLWIGAKGELLVSGSQAGVITIWGIADREQLHSFTFDKIPAAVNPRIVAVRLTADRTKVIAITEASVKIFDVSSGKNILAFELPNKFPRRDSDERYTFSEDSVIADDGFIARHTAPGCKIEELMFVSLKDTKTFVTIDKPANCEMPKSEEGAPIIFANPKKSSVIIARSGIPEFKQWDLQTRHVTRTIKWPNETSSKIIGLDRDFRFAMGHDADKLRIREF